MSRLREESSTPWTSSLTMCRPGRGSEGGTNQLVGREFIQTLTSSVRSGAIRSRLPIDTFGDCVSPLEVMMDPNPDYDASDEIEYFFQFVPWGLRGVYPPPAYPPV